MVRRRPLLALLAALAMAAAAGCGGAEHERLEADTEGLFIQFPGSELIYQVQLSRQLNPYIVDDRAYFVGIPPQKRILTGDHVWFAVFMRAQNVGEEPERPADVFWITDTTEEEYFPVDLGEDNVFAWRPEIVREDETIPRINSAANERPPNGALLLFRLEREALDNRPLELHVASPGEGEDAIIRLDV